jgi:hypothetical protein
MNKSFIVQNDSYIDSIDDVSGGFFVVIDSLTNDVIPSTDDIGLKLVHDEVVIAANSGVELFVIDKRIELFIKTHR